MHVGHTHPNKITPFRADSIINKPQLHSLKIVVKPGGLMNYGLNVAEAPYFYTLAKPSLKQPQEKRLKTSGLDAAKTVLPGSTGIL